MKINKFPEGEEFCVITDTIAGVMCKLIFPRQIGVKWDNANKIFRSSIWTEDGELVSAGFRKFTNYGEAPDFEPFNESAKDIEYIKKIDGSCLIISKFRGELIVRTRGTFSAENSMANGHEIAELKARYPSLFDNAILAGEKHSVLVEWYSPQNVIVERESDQPEVWLTDIVNHEDYSYLPQNIVDDYGKLWGVQRPTRYSFSTLPEMLQAVKEWRNGEGIVLYCNNGQILKKAKADRYLFVHRIKSQINTEDNFVDLFISAGTPNYAEFYSYIETNFDWELAQQMRGRISNICEQYEQVKKIIAHMKEFVTKLNGKDKTKRKEAAEMIISAYGNTNRASMVFQLLDGRELSNEQIKKLIFQVAKR